MFGLDRAEQTSWGSASTIGWLAAAIAGEAIPGVSVSPSIEGLAWVVAWIVGLTGVIGNVLILLGLFDDGDDLMRGWRRERMGLTLAISSWGAYALAVAASYPSALISWGFPAAIAVGHAVGRLGEALDLHVAVEAEDLAQVDFLGGFGVHVQHRRALSSQRRH